VPQGDRPWIPTSAILTNDIGVYLIERETWTGHSLAGEGKARTALRAAPLSVLNLGRIYLQRGKWQEALREL